MAGLDPAIHDFIASHKMPGTCPGMTER